MTFSTGHTVVNAIIIVGLCVGLSLSVLWLVRRSVSPEYLKLHNEIGGIVYAVVGVIYGIVLGLSVVGVWDGYRSAEENANSEANAVGNVYRIAGGLPDPAGQMIRQSVLAYASTVVDDEWPAMRRGDSSGSQSQPALDVLWTAFYSAEVSNPRDQDLYASGLDQLESLSADRQERLFQSEGGLLGIMWAVVIGGAVITVLFPCLFGAENGVVHAIVIATLALTLGLLLYLVNDVNGPFRGTVHVEPDGLRHILAQFGGAPAPD